MKCAGNGPISAPKMRLLTALITIDVGGLGLQLRLRRPLLCDKVAGVATASPTEPRTRTSVDWLLMSSTRDGAFSTSNRW